MEGAAVHQSRYVREASLRVTQAFISAYGKICTLRRTSTDQNCITFRGTLEVGGRV